jgi:tight adherence protein B
MWILPTTFALSFGFVLGVYWLFVLRPETGARQAVNRRLRKAREPKSPRIDFIKEVKRLSSIPALDAALTRAGLTSNWLQRVFDSADLSISVGSFLLGTALLGAVTYLVVQLLIGRTGLALVAGLVATAVPYLLVRRHHAMRLMKFEEQFPEAIDLIARAMRAGHGLTTGLGMVADELGAPAGREFRLLYDWQNYGMSLPEALHRFADRVPLLDARFFVTSVLTQREAGGNLSEVLDNLSKMIRERFRIKRQIRVISAHGRMTGVVLGSLPPALALYFFIVRPEYLSELLSDPLGVRMVIGAVVLQILGVLIMRRLTNIEY